MLGTWGSLLGVWGTGHSRVREGGPERILKREPVIRRTRRVLDSSFWLALGSCQARVIRHSLVC